MPMYAHAHAHAHASAPSRRVSASIILPSREAVWNDVTAPTQKGFAPEPPARENLARLRDSERAQRVRNNSMDQKPSYIYLYLSS